MTIVKKKNDVFNTDFFWWICCSKVRKILSLCMKYFNMWICGWIWMWELKSFILNGDKNELSKSIHKKGKNMACLFFVQMLI